MKSTKYVSKQPDAQGIIHYTQQEHQTWHDLYVRQIDIIQNRACQEYIDGIELLQMSHERIPQVFEMNNALLQASGWSIAPVPALIEFDEFFNLLSQRKFPAATFIRTREDFDYIQEPDIFHEFFGHCPMITVPRYGDFMQQYGELGKHALPKQQKLLARLFWFTVEFGLIRTAQGLRIYGGGILSSMEETIYAVDSPTPERIPLDVLHALRTPYRIDIKQPIYYVIEDFQELYQLMDLDLLSLVDQALALGEFEPKY